MDVVGEKGWEGQMAQISFVVRFAAELPMTHTVLKRASRCRMKIIAHQKSVLLS